MLASERVVALTMAPLLAFAGAVAAAEAWPIESMPAVVSLTGGSGSNVDVYGIGAMWQIPWKKDVLARHGIELRVGADLLRWDGRNDGAPDRFLWDASITPYLRWRLGEGAWHRTFAQLGAGVHLLSRTAINGSRNFATAVQFGERLAWGLNLGPGNRYEMTLFGQHVSNGGIRQPNNGLTYYGATFGISID